MARIWKDVDTGGKVVLSTAASGGSTLMDGLGIPNCSLSVRQTNASFRPMEARAPHKFPGVVEWRVSLNRGLEDARIAGASPHTIGTLMTLDDIYCTYKDANGSVIYAGWTTWEDLTDSQRTLEAADQSMSLVSTGDPDVPAANADPASWPYA